MRAGPELVADAGCQIAEGPVWHAEEACLYWTDISAGRLYRFGPATGAYETVYQGEPVGGITVQSDGSLLLVGARGRVQVWRDGDVTDVILADIANERDTRFNDVIADARGRVISGTMAVRDETGQITRYGRLYRVDTDGRAVVLMEGVGSPNGMGFSRDSSHLYFTDSLIGAQTIFLFDYDLDTGTVSNRRTFYQAAVDGSDGRPDGMTVDDEGSVWSAQWDGGAVLRFGVDGHVRDRFAIPPCRVSSVTFGGRDYTDLYVTTAGGSE